MISSAIRFAACAPHATGSSLADRCKTHTRNHHDAPTPPPGNGWVGPALGRSVTNPAHEEGCPMLRRFASVLAVLGLLMLLTGCLKVEMALEISPEGTVSGTMVTAMNKNARSEERRVGNKGDRT